MMSPSVDLDFYLTQFAAHLHAITALAQVSEAQARWKPTPEEWSILEVICHLRDEEREDFRAGVDYILHRPTDGWPKINPPQWVVERAYNQQPLAEVLTAFTRERQTSLAWLRDLSAPDWATTAMHPHFGPFQARDMLAAWLAHDLLHIRQLNHLQWQYLATQVAPLALDYAGGW